MRLLRLTLFEFGRRSHQMRAKFDIFSGTPVHCILLTLLIYYRLRGELLVRHSWLILLQMMATWCRKLAIDVPLLLLATTMLLSIKIALWLINCDLIAYGAIFILLVVPDVPFVHFDRKLFDIFYAKIRNWMPAFTLGQFGQSRDANQKRRLAHAFFMLFWKQLEEVANCGWAIEGLFESHFTKSLFIYVNQFWKFK